MILKLDSLETNQAFYFRNAILFLISGNGLVQV